MKISIVAHKSWGGGVGEIIWKGKEGTQDRVFTKNLVCWYKLNKFNDNID